MMKDKRKIHLGQAARKLLLIALPFMIFLALSLTVCVASLDGETLLKERQTIFLVLETISRFAVCVSLGTVLTDYAEKRTAN